MRAERDATLCVNLATASCAYGYPRSVGGIAVVAASPVVVLDALAPDTSRLVTDEQKQWMPHLNRQMPWSATFQSHQGAN
jgi:hypothetical protein